MTPSDIKAEFMGKVTASVTHEIQNVLAVIKENAGLMEDITLMMSRDSGLSGMEEKLGTCLNTIKKQAYRGVSMTSHLNAFAHTPDRMISTFNPAETLQKLLTISERIFKLKGTSVSFTEPPSASSLTTDPVLFQLLVFTSLETLVATLSPADLSMDLDVSDSKIRITFTLPETGFDSESLTQALLSENLNRARQLLEPPAEALAHPAGIRLIFSNTPQ